MKHAKEQLDQMKRDINAAQVISTRVKLERDGTEFIGLCPFHKENTPSFRVYKADGGVWLFKCFGCSANGNVFQFFEKLDKISFGQAVDKVVTVSGWVEGKQAVESVFTEVLEGEKKYSTYPLSVLKQAEKGLAESQDARGWLSGRGITYETAKSLRIGFIQSARAIKQSHPWVDKGWIVIPTINDGTITCLKYRSLVAKKSEDGRTSGILRGPNMKTSLYNIEACQPFDDVFVVEGEPDAIVLTQAGYNAVAYPSAEYTPTSSERDQLVKANRIFLAGDSDGPGQTAMKKLWNELRERTYMLEWPEGIKDANDALTKTCGNDTDKFQEMVETLKSKALERPIPDFYDVRQTLRNADDTNPMDDPRRLHATQREVDEMAVTLPGNVVSVFATYSGTGKTTWLLDQIEMEEVRRGSVVINYSAELSPQEFNMLVTANLLQKNRLKLTREDYDEAARRLDELDSKFYVGYNPDLNRIGPVLDTLEWAIRRLGAKVVVLDHLHFLCRGERDDIKAQADAMQRIKNLAVKYQTIFIVVGQSRKEQQARSGRPSKASDAKGSESFISDATTTYHIHRDYRTDIDPANPPDDLLSPVTDVRLFKCRTKGPGKAFVKQTFAGEIGKFFPYRETTA